MKVSWKSNAALVGLALTGSLGVVVYAQQPPQNSLPSISQTIDSQPQAVSPAIAQPPINQPPMVQVPMRPSSPGQWNSPVATIAPVAPVASTGPLTHVLGMARWEPASPKLELLTWEDDQFRIERLDGPPTPEQLSAQRAAQSKLREAEKMLRNEKGSEQEKTEAKDLLRSYFAAQFQHDLDVRKEQIQLLEEQLAKLKSIVDKRSDQMKKIVELRMTLLENDSNGLGFPPAFHQLPHQDHLQPVPGMPGMTGMPGMRMMATPNYSGSYPSSRFYPSGGTVPTPIPPRVPQSNSNPSYFTPDSFTPSQPAKAGDGRKKPAPSLEDGV
ncbi:hypothetical protein VN12_03675 [Pirellula sp. SH-Sr6A]|uniref:hypothetical protein n=1 Tax=Pirellula sp. SH-Sr6A TaxID=1632865 RepID=UPI00078E05D6|nr:hypothetical protein [Pirellula sp. SH-Sr6A]AMV31192.1 hypothetical protein VN12_03675 [Pirellula sp. SH-Sr6A]